MTGLRALPRSFYRRPADSVARDLLGRYLVRDLDGVRLVARLVETEAYLGFGDRASHAWGGRRTPRNESMYLPAGHAYVYFIYGMHFCLNVIVGRAGEPQAVLLRAAVPVRGGQEMARRRGLDGAARGLRPGDLLGGPGKLAQALGVARQLDGAPLWRGALRLTEGLPAGAGDVVIGPRVGVDYAGEAAGWPLRFAVRGESAVSRPRVGLVS